MRVECLKFALIFCFISVFYACSSSIAVYDQYAYSQVTSIKVDVLELMQNANSDYTKSEDAIRKMDVLIRKAMEYERHRPRNSIITEMWTRLYDPSFQLYGGFLARWKLKSRLEPEFISEQREIIGLAFDQIAELESKLSKRK